MSTSCHTQTGGSLHKGRVIPNYRISLNPNKLNKAAIASGRPSSRQFCIKPPIVLDNPTRNPYVSGSGKMIRFCKLIPVFCNNSTRAPYPKVEKVEGGTASAALVGAEGARPSPPPPASHPPLAYVVSIPKHPSSLVLVGQQPRSARGGCSRSAPITSNMAPSTRACSPAPASACPRT